MQFNHERAGCSPRAQQKLRENRAVCEPAFCVCGMKALFLNRGPYTKNMKITYIRGRHVARVREADFQKLALMYAAYFAGNPVRFEETVPEYFLLRVRGNDDDVLFTDTEKVFTEEKNDAGNLYGSPAEIKYYVQNAKWAIKIEGGAAAMSFSFTVTIFGNPPKRVRELFKFLADAKFVKDVVQDRTY